MIFRILTLHKPFLFFIALIFNGSLFSQVFPPASYPKGYFIYPVVAKVGLVANFGELRPNHYHMGLDCRTDQTENHRVLAAADGYIAHVRIEPSGFGRAIYINHPNGLTTLYGHLNNFFPELEKYVKEQQYRIESWKVFLDIPPGLFPVKKGDFIAFSGNTGGSQGPHCHFEIRDTKTDKVLNPLLFGFPIADNVPPTILRLAVYNRRLSTYSQTPKLFPLIRKNGYYTVKGETVNLNTDKVSFGISAFDRSNGSANPNGIYQAVLYSDDQPINGFRLDSISYDETRYENAHIDYMLRASGGPFVEHLSRLPGYPPGVYKDVAGDGVITLDERVHQIRVEVMDANGNISVLKFGVKKTGSSEIPPVINSTQTFYPGFINIFEQEDVMVVLGENDLYDSIHFTYAKLPSVSATAVSAMHRIHTALVPVHGYYTIKLKANSALTPEQSSKVVMERNWAGKKEVVKTAREGEWYIAKFREFGNFQLLVDQLPPVIITGFADHANLKNRNQIAVIVSDNNHAVNNFTAWLNGKWLRFTNDKGRAFIYKFDEKCPAGDNELRIRVNDEAGNRTENIYHFTR